VLVDDVFTNRMSGDPVQPEEDLALGKWLDRVPAPKGVNVDTDAIARGQELFDSPEVGCKSCHNGALLTNNAMANVHGGTFKVPSLIGIGGRSPYMHDGCAATLKDRFGYCGGGDAHGHTSQLTSAQIDDLIAYLESL
jgi:cytochrome c peroxidase